MTIEEKTAIMAEALQKQTIMKQSCTKEKKVNMPGFTDFFKEALICTQECITKIIKHGFGQLE